MYVCVCIYLLGGSKLVIGLCVVSTVEREKEREGDEVERMAKTHPLIQ